MSSGQRMFVAAVLAEDALADLEVFIEPRRDTDPRLRWVDPEHWHITLAFLPAVHHRCLDDLEERLDLVATESEPFELYLAGAGAFPDAGAARVLWLQPREGGEPRMASLARRVRNAANAAGTAVDGAAFRGHITVARMSQPLDASRWLGILDTYAGPSWYVEEIHLIASHLGQGRRGRPRYETVASFPLGTGKS